MPTLPTDYITILGTFMRLFSDRSWNHAKILLIGAILSPAERTVTAALRVTGLRMEKHFQNYHRVLNRAKWSSLEASRIVLNLLISTFAIRGPVIMGLDDTIERRRGAKIKAKGIYTCTSTQVQVSGSGSFDAWPLCQSEWVALVEPDVVGTYSLGWTHVGLAIPHGLGTFGKILSRQSSAT